MLCVQQFVSAQNAMLLKVESPSSLAGFYDLYRSQFGPADNNVVGPADLKLAAPNLGCGALTNSLANTIGVVDRGTCNFITKVKNLQNAGAIAVIICNNDSAPTTPSGTDATITIKSFLMEKPECEKIKLAMASGTVNASLVPRECRPYAPANTIFGGNPGEGDFNAGLNGWTTDTELGKGWEWTANGDCGKGTYMFDECRLVTPTVCNGTMMMDSDYLNEQGICGAPCESSLISPTIDVSNVDIKGLFIQFNQGIRQLNSDYFLMLSYDNGVTWPDTFTLNANINPNTDFFTNQRVKLPLCTSRTDFDKITLRFHISGNYYFWGLDDIFLINESFSDPQTNDNFWATAPNLKVPKGQVTEFPVLSDIKNNGNSVSPNTVLNCKVNAVNADNTLGEEIYNENYVYGNVGQCEQIENKVFDFLVEPKDEVGTYQVTYQISSDDNSVSTNDTRSSRFFVTENEFSNALSEAELGSEYLENWLNGVNPQFAFGASNDIDNVAMGTHYYFPNGSKVKATSFTFGVDDADLPDPFGASVICRVYKIVGPEDPTTAGLISGSEKVVVGQGYSEVDNDYVMFLESTTENLRSLTFQLQDLNGGDLVLEDNTGYIFVVHVTNIADNNTFIPLLGFNPNTSNQTLRWSYTGATDLAFDELGIDRHYGTVTSFNATASSDIDELDQRDFRSNLPYKFYTSVIVEEASNTEDVLADNALSIYPNPTSDKLFFDMNLEKVSKNVRIEIMGIDGKLAYAEDFTNVRTELLKINTNNFTSGVYLAKVITDEGTLSKKVIVSK